MTALSDGYVANYYMLAPTEEEVQFPPTVNIPEPVEGTEFTQSSEIRVTADVSDDGTITKVEFFAGTSEPLTFLGEADAPPYTFTFTPDGLGLYTLRVVATDDSGLTAEGSVTVAVIDPAIETVSTAVGTGADVQMNEHTGSSSNDEDLNTRTSGDGDRNEVVVLRFDLSGYTLSELSEVSLNIVNYRDNSARQVALYGVAPGTRSGTGLYTTEDWEETGLSVFGDLPGVLESDGDFLTQSLNMDQLTPLGQITFSNQTKGSVETFDDPALATFLQNDTGSSLVTFILAAAPGYSSSGQARFASKEAAALDGGTPSGVAGDFAPYLQFTAGGPAAPLFNSVGLNEDGTVTLLWEGEGTLEMTTGLPGGRTPVPDASSPHTISTDEGSMFFRIAQ